VSNHNLAEKCNDAGVTQYINGNPAHVGEQAPKTRAATVEAIIAAIYLDSGRNLDIVKRVMGALGLDAFNDSG
jgi:ribonuclease-3